MFTGLVEELGRVDRLDDNGDSVRLTVIAPLAVADAEHGDSISVSGVCLTVVARDAASFTADVMKQTLDMSTLGALAAGAPVNLERAARVGDRLGGHIVQGHVDGTATVLETEDGDAWRRVRFDLDDELAPLLVDKGSVTLDGVSLTVSAISEPGAEHGWFEVSLIPETLSATTLGQKAAGDRVNVETDVIARHVRRMLRLDALAGAPMPAPAAQTPAPDTEPVTPISSTPSASTPALGDIELALDHLRRGRPVIVADDESRENEGDVILSAELASQEWLAWLVRVSSGFVCAPMTAEIADRLDLPPMVAHNEDARGTAYTVSVDAAAGVTTGISASDRARTLRVLADATTVRDDLHRPGHILPLRAVAGGVRVRNGHTEAAVDLMQAAGLRPVAAISEIVADDGEMMRLPGLVELGRREGVPVITIAALADWLTARDEATAAAGTPTAATPTADAPSQITPTTTRSTEGVTA